MADPQAPGFDWAQVLVPLAAAAVSAYSPRYGAAGVQGGLGALGAMQNYREGNVRLQDLVQKHEIDKQQQEQWVKTLHDLSTPGTPEHGGVSGNVPASTETARSNAFEGGGQPPSPAGFHLDPAQAQALAMLPRVEGAKRLSEIMQHYKPEDPTIPMEQLPNLDVSKVPAGMKLSGKTPQGVSFDYTGQKADKFSNPFEMAAAQNPNADAVDLAGRLQRAEHPQAPLHDSYVDASGNQVMGIVDPTAGTSKNVTLGRARPQAAMVQKSETEADLDAAAQSIAGGDLTSIKDVSSMRGGQRARLYGKIKALNPKFSVAELDRKIKMASDFTTGKDAQSLQSFGTFLAHAGEAADANDALSRTSAPLMNKPINWLMQNVQGSPELQRFMTSLEPVRKEYEGFLLGGHAMYGDDRKAVETILNNNASPAQIRAALNQMGNTAKARYDQMNFRYKKNMGRDIEAPFSDEAIVGARKIGIDLGAAPAGLSGDQKPAGGSQYVRTGTDKQGRRVGMKADGSIEVIQ